MQPHSKAQKRTPRRAVVIDPGLQYRAATAVTILVGGLLVLLNIALIAMRRGQTRLIAANTSDLNDQLVAGDTRMAIVVAAGSVLVAGLVFLGTVLATHRTAGAIVGVRRQLEAVRDGDLHAVLRLRAGDNLRSLEAPFNDMIASLRRQIQGDALALDGLAAKLESSTDNTVARQAAEEIRSQAHALRDRLGRGDRSPS